jgi:hypothetical protein
VRGPEVSEHGADVAVFVALNGFTKPGADFARRHGITLMGRPELKRWGRTASTCMRPSRKNTRPHNPQ